MLPLSNRSIYRIDAMNLSETTSKLERPARGFDHKEFQNRLSKVQVSMAERGIDALLLTTESDFYYFTGFLTQFWQSPTRCWYLILPQSGLPVAVIPEIGAVCMQRTWVNDIRTWQSPDGADEGLGLLTETLTELLGSHAVSALPMGNESYLRMPLLQYDQLRKQLPNYTWIDASHLLQKQRQIKSAAEQAKIRFVCHVVSTAFEQIPDIVSAGLSEQDVFRKFKEVCLQLGVDDTAYLVGGSGEGGYKDIISPPTSHQLLAGDILMLDTGCRWDGYFCDFDRNFAIGTANSPSRDTYRLLWDATEAGLEFIRPGVTCAEVYNTMNQVINPHVANSSSEGGRFGHGLGIQLTETPSIAAFDHTCIEDGMVLTLEPACEYGNGQVMVHEENIVISEGRAQLLTQRAPPEIPQI